jgi:hypothetical protein
LLPDLTTKYRFESLYDNAKLQAFILSGLETKPGQTPDPFQYPLCTALAELRPVVLQSPEGRYTPNPDQEVEDPAKYEWAKELVERPSAVEELEEVLVEA